MSTETLVRPDQPVASSTTVSPLHRVVEEIRQDCQRDSESYLDESTVPHGGE